MGSVVKGLCESWQAVECWVLTCCRWPEVVDRLLLFRFFLSRITAIFKNDNGAPKIVMVSKVDVMIEEKTKATGSSNSTDQAFLRDMQQLSGGSNNSSNNSSNNNSSNSSSSVFAQELNATTLDGVDPATREMLVRWLFMALVWTFWTVFFSFDMSLTTSSCFIISLFLAVSCMLPTAIHHVGGRRIPKTTTEKSAASFQRRNRQLHGVWF